MKDEATRIAAMRTAKGDYMGWLANSAISTTEQAEALVKTNPDIVLIPYAYRSTTSTAFDVDKPPFDDIRVRRAMQMALDLETINTIYFKGWATVEPMGQVRTGAIEYVTPFNEWPEDIKPYYMYDPEGAIALLDEAGFTPDEDGIRISGSSVFHATSDLALADIFADYWKEIGIDIEIVKGPDNTTVGTWIREHTYPHDMVGSAIMGYDRSPITILRSFIHSEGGYNYTGVRNPEFDAMIEGAGRGDLRRAAAHHQRARSGALQAAPVRLGDEGTGVQRGPAVVDRIQRRVSPGAPAAVLSAVRPHVAGSGVESTVHQLASRPSGTDRLIYWGSPEVTSFLAPPAGFRGAIVRHVT